MLARGYKPVSSKAHRDVMIPSNVFCYFVLLLTQCSVVKGAGCWVVLSRARAVASPGHVYTETLSGTHQPAAHSTVV